MATHACVIKTCALCFINYALQCDGGLAAFAERRFGRWCVPELDVVDLYGAAQLAFFEGLLVLVIHVPCHDSHCDERAEHPHAKKGHSTSRVLSPASSFSRSPDVDGAVVHGYTVTIVKIAITPPNIPAKIRIPTPGPSLWTR